MPDFELDDDLIRKLSSLLEETGLSEIEYEAEGRRIRVARNAGPSHAPAPVAPVPQAPTRVDGQQGSGPSAEAAPAGAVLSPMVGTAYLSPEPGAPSFVSVGDQVSEGQSLLIIESMKVINQIPSPRAGRVARIMITDGHPVEFEEPLLVIE